MPLFQGLILGASICGSVGPQSLFVLRQGIRGEAALLVALICTLVDFAMIATAIAGADAVVAMVPHAASIASWGAAASIFAFASFSFARAARRASGVSFNLGGRAVRACAPVIIVTLALSLLNPQVYLEVMAVVGVVGLHFPSGDRWLFGIGVALVSPLWFFGLAFGGRRIAPLFARPGMSRAADMITSFVMIALAVAILGAEFGWL